MSEVLTEIQARNILLLISNDGGTTYLPVARLTSNKIGETLNALDATSKDSNHHIPGVKFEGTIDCEGNCVDITGTPAHSSYVAMHALFAAGTVFFAKFGPATPVTGNSVFSGQLFINKFNLDAKDTDLYKFTASFTIVFPPLTVTTT